MPKLQSLVQGCNLLSQTLVQWYACYEEAVFVGSALTSNMYSHGIEKSACVPQKIIAQQTWVLFCVVVVVVFPCPKHL